MIKTVFSSGKYTSTFIYPCRLFEHYLKLKTKAQHIIIVVPWPLEHNINDKYFENYFQSVSDAELDLRAMLTSARW